MDLGILLILLKGFSSICLIYQNTIVLCILNAETDFLLVDKHTIFTNRGMIQSIILLLFGFLNSKFLIFFLHRYGEDYQYLTMTMMAES